MTSSPLPKTKPKAFTLIELLMVIMIISILAALTLGAFRFANVKAGRDKTKAVIKAMELALDKYELDYGDYPGAPLATNNHPLIGADVEGAKHLYMVLTGDDGGSSGYTGATAGNGEIDGDEEPFMDFGTGLNDSLSMFEGDATSGFYFADPFGNPIQYSVMIDTSPTGSTTPQIEPSNPHDRAGNTNNNATYDLWSYGDAETITDGTTGAGEEAKWIKNW